MLKFTESGLEGVKAELSWLDDLMESKGLIRAGQWDYERVTYDKKFSTIEVRFTCGYKVLRQKAMSEAGAP